MDIKLVESTLIVNEDLKGIMNTVGEHIMNAFKSLLKLFDFIKEKVCSAFKIFMTKVNSFIEKKPVEKEKKEEPKKEKEKKDFYSECSDFHRLMIVLSNISDMYEKDVYTLTDNCIKYISKPSIMDIGISFTMSPLERIVDTFKICKGRKLLNFNTCEYQLDSFYKDRTEIESYVNKIETETDKTKKIVSDTFDKINDFIEKNNNGDKGWGSMFKILHGLNDIIKLAPMAITLMISHIGSCIKCVSYYNS